MSALRAPIPDPTVTLSLAILEDVMGDYHPRDFAVRLWEGTLWNAEPGQPVRFQLVLEHPGALRRMFLGGSRLALAEAYIYKDFDIEGDIEAIFPLTDFLTTRPWKVADRLRLVGRLRSLPATGPAREPLRAAQLRGPLHTVERDRLAATSHYDLPGEFFALWLDPRRVYSCAYFTAPDRDLESAQLAKLDYVCRKLRLQAGERLLDIGCGWGGLVLHAAQRYGADSTGITLSLPQAQWANEEIERAGLSARARVRVCDYRHLPETEAFDKLASVGMFEHVGEERLPEYFARAGRLLRPGGVFLNHSISVQAGRPLPSEKSFAAAYVFPDAEPVPLHRALRSAEEAGFEVRDVESLREHYALTLRHWLRRLQAHEEEATTLVGPTVDRIWKLFLAGEAHSFDQGWLSVHQVLLIKPDRSSGRASAGLPLTREDWSA